ncbi:MAG TPA: TIGR01777 family oxidoreductase [Streptosporangiaceae bacterium]|nr:TIGR01777 family oxidoreductase [Streptosporangiaceae bacterium]
MGLKYASVVDAPLNEVFAWHARPGAITRLMPPWPPVRVEREAGSVRDGQAVLRLPGGLRWVAAHQPGKYDPPHEFADTLASLPLSAVLPWRHTHQFAVAGQRATRVTDVVDTPLPARMLRPMFAYRHRQLADDLAAQARARELSPEPLTIAVTGSGGLIGTALTALLSTGGHDVIRLVRRLPRHAGERYWRPEDPGPDLLSGVDALIHLAGASIGGRFTAGRKQEIRDSRILPTRRLAELAADTTPGLRAFVTASAIGIYGPDRGDEVLTETSARGDGFLAGVVADWEDAATPAARAGLRTVQVRTGLVQTPRGGMLHLLYPLFAAGLGGQLGSGKQWLAWIGLDDLLDIFLRAVLDPALSGPVNAVAPVPVRNADYTAVLASLLRRPALVPVPPLGPRLLLGGEGARELAEASQDVRPQRLINAGHYFRYPELEAALRHALGREPAVRSAIRIPGGPE